MRLDDARVAIVGGSMAGLSAAVAVRALGANVVVFERATSTTCVPCAAIAAANALALRGQRPPRFGMWRSCLPERWRSRRSVAL